MTDRELNRPIDRLMIASGQDMEMSEVDVTVMTDDAIEGLVSTGDAEGLVALIDRVLAETTDEVETGQLLGFRAGLPHPEGWSGRRWLSATRDRMAEVLADPTAIPHYAYQDRTGFEPPKASRWHFSNPTFDVLGPLVDELDAWMAEPADDTWFRRHVLVDAGRSVGKVAPVVHHDLGQEVLWDQAVSTSWVSLGVERLVRRGDWTVGDRDLYDRRGWAVVYSRAELPLDSMVRRRFPDLVHLFGGYLGQPFDDEHGWPQWKISELMRRTRGSARDRMRAQLAELLTIESDDELTATVGHLGSYCLPYFMRHWIDRLHWKIDALDWGPPVRTRDDSPPLPDDA